MRLKATPATVRLYRDHDLVATHPRQQRPGARSTVDDHMPPNALAYAMQAARKLGKESVILVNLSGRGDKDLPALAMRLDAEGGATNEHRRGTP